MAHESLTAQVPSTITGTRSDPANAITFFSVKCHGIVSTSSPLCASAILVRQQNGLNLRLLSLPARSYILIAITKSSRPGKYHIQSDWNKAHNPVPHGGFSETLGSPSTRRAPDGTEPSAAAIRAATSRNSSA